jgi:hypothetical protein
MKLLDNVVAVVTAEGFEGRQRISARARSPTTLIIIGQRMLCPLEQQIMCTAPSSILGTGMRRECEASSSRSSSWAAAEISRVYSGEVQIVSWSAKISNTRANCCSEVSPAQDWDHVSAIL